MKKTLGLVGLAAVTLGSSFSAIPALASTSDCGPKPTGGTLTESNGVCTLKFTKAGTYNFTAPKALVSLAAASIGGGAGFKEMGSNGGWAVGYAGNAGSVDYVDFTNVTKGQAFNIVIGAGGTTGENATNGVNSTITSGTQTLTGTGGAPQSTDNECAMGSNTGVGVGDGAGGPTTSRDGEPCAQGPSFNFVTAFPALFTTNDVVIGLGGMIYSSGIQSALKPGSGAGARITSTEPSTWVSFDPKGADGAAIFRWKVPAGLANTGTDSQGSAGLAAGAILLGGALMVSGSKRNRGVARHRA